MTERQVRYYMSKAGLRVRKSRAQRTNLDNHGGFMVVNDNNWIVGGQRFDLTLNDLEGWVEEIRKEAQAI